MDTSQTLSARGASLRCTTASVLARYMVSHDPDFERKAADIIGLYLNPPQHAAVFRPVASVATSERGLPMPTKLAMPVFHSALGRT